MLRPFRLTLVILLIVAIITVIAFIPWLKMKITTNNPIFDTSTPSTIPGAGLQQSSTSSKVPKTDPQILEGLPCQGQTILVNYPLLKDSSKTPSECKPFCATRKMSKHYILYSDGFGTQCGIENCQDWGEDKCITCTVPDGLLSQLGLSQPTNPAPCKK